MNDEQHSSEERMSDLLGRASSERQEAARQRADAVAYATEQRATRYVLLRIHAWMGMLLGTAMLFTGTAQVFETQIGTWTRPFFGGLALLAGIILMAGIDSRGGSERDLVEVVGLSLKAFWDVAMALGFVVSIVQYGTVEWRLPWDLGVIDPSQPRPYGPFVYIGLASMISVVHLPACWRDLRSHRG